MTVHAVLLEVPGYATIEGSTDTSYHTKRQYFKFRGLYYAQQPTALTRFLPPVPFTPAPGAIYDATGTAPPCNQPASVNGGDENCLIVNVFSPRLPGNASDPNTSYDDLLPVIYWIHGGGFSLGSVLTYSAEKYMDKDVVLVEVQYRLGPLGWLSLNTDEVPGNAGLFDQIEGLRWTQKFVKYFGGNPNSVTIAGESAGSASVSTLLLAPQARGLFHRAIGESGSILAPWALDRKPVEAARRIAEIAGCPLEPYLSLLECLRLIDAKNITNAYFDYMAEDNLKGGLGFGGSSPIIQVAGAQKALDKEPQELFETGNYYTEVPIMFGANEQEGTLILGILYDSYLVPNNLTNDSEFLKTQLVPLIINAVGLTDESGELAAALTAKYLANAELGNFASMAPGLIDMCSVLFFKESCHETTILHSKFNPNSYWYSFIFEGRNSLWNAVFRPPRPPMEHGVSHADELLYMFNFPTYTNNATEAVLSRRMLDVWTAFAKYGNPTPDGVTLEDGVPKFPAITEKEDAYMTIDGQWSVQYNYSLTYTATVDQSKP